MWIFEENEGSENKTSRKNGISMVDLVLIDINDNKNKWFSYEN